MAYSQFPNSIAVSPWVSNLDTHRILIADGEAFECTSSNSVVGDSPVAPLRMLHARSDRLTKGTDHLQSLCRLSCSTHSIQSPAYVPLNGDVKFISEVPSKHFKPVSIVRHEAVTNNSLLDEAHMGLARAF